ncbi:hypothetical protein Tco_0730434 [Tanacetum coccineum]|uniref:Uncharacterized protein n=1 Tax=Tanacetum coccineum TaxID=301880 RepID=A0ABQ4YUT4_9ASTR
MVLSLTSCTIPTSLHLGYHQFKPFGCWNHHPHWKHLFSKKAKTSRRLSCSAAAEQVEFQVLSNINSVYNDILILDTPQSRMLLLDSTHNVHSVFNKDGDAWTGSYWDEFATLPPIIPDGPIAILGLHTEGGGILHVHIGDALSPSTSIPGGYAGIVVDLFSGGDVLPQLQEYSVVSLMLNCFCHGICALTMFDPHINEK